ncbi:unnamed protein product [Auanema sp. JU1783]|nr:unnamed protein product [Auanema sp. JU1783]
MQDKDILDKPTFPDPISQNQRLEAIDQRLDTLFEKLNALVANQDDFYYMLKQHITANQADNCVFFKRHKDSSSCHII